MSIFAGFDLSSESVEYYVQNGRGRVLKRGTMSWSKRKWKGFVEEFGSEDLKVAFETGPEAYRAQRILKSLGVETYPFHAGHFPSIWKTKKKTDRIDAKKICQALKMGGLPERVILPEDQEAILRNLTTERELTLKQIGQRRNRVRGLARQWGARLPKYDYCHPERWWEEVVEAFPKNLEQFSKILSETEKVVFRC